MDISDLQTFRAVVEQGGVTAAARQLHRVQSSVSARLASLERELGCALFERVGRSMALTPEGRHLYHRSAGIVRELAGLRHELALTSRGAVLRIGAMESTAAVRLAQPLARLRREHPQMRLTLRTGTTGALLGMLERCEVDAVFVAGPSERAEFDWHEAFREELVLIAPKHAAGAATTLVTFSAGCAYREVARNWAAEHGLALSQEVEIGSYHALVASVSAGMGVGLVPRSVMKLADTSAIAVKRLGPAHSRQITWFVTRAGSRSAAVTALRAAIGPDRPKKNSHLAVAV
jgi:DNA-binding transcriptional LysR family regulator